jgi:redox-sensitive bicupin YhaK (pirin superfamily)
MATNFAPTTASTKSAADRHVERVLSAPRMLEGEGFEVRRAIPAGGLPAVGPFIFLDHFGPVTYDPGEAKGAPNHPHRGFETLTWLLEGSGIHRDSLGNVSVIGAGEGQWMRAGSGILHDEGADKALRTHGGLYEGVQFWINLPKGRKMSPPAYRAIGRDLAPARPAGAGTLTLIAGRLDGDQGPIETWADPWLAYATLPTGEPLVIAPEAAELAVYVVAGIVTISNRIIDEGQLAVLTAGDRLAVHATSDAKLFILGGAPLDAPLFRYGPFVMNTEAEVHQAVRDYQAGLFGTIPPRVAG